MFSAPPQPPSQHNTPTPTTSHTYTNTYTSLFLFFPLTPHRLFDIFSKDPPPRTQFMRHAIRSPRYGVEYGSTLLILLISLAFALISPIIVIFGAMFCGGMWIYWR